jgi:putative endonuclease
MFYVYILRCRNASLYVGYTQNVEARIKAHNIGRGAAHTYKHGPVQLVYSEAHPTRLTAIRRERQLKRWTRRKKEALIQGDLARLRALSKRRT